MLSSAGSSFKKDFNALFDDGQLGPMTHVFQKAPEGIRHFWSSEMLFAGADPGQDPRPQGTIEPLWNMMDLMPEGAAGLQRAGGISLLSRREVRV